MATIASFEINHTQYLDEAGSAQERFPSEISDTLLVDMYKDMVFCRAYDKKAVALQRTGRISTYAPMIGQEAVDVGIAHAMETADVLVPFYRNVGTQLLRGVRMVEHFLYYGGNERGSDFKGPDQDFMTQVNLSTQFPHAVGVGMAMKLRGEQRAAVATIGDGACSKGDFYEAINLAGVWKAPVLFIAVNNRWAISIPYKSQTAAETLAQKAIAAGIRSEQVDGNDVVAVYDRVNRALNRIRSGDGPYFIELDTYRLGDHTTADDASRYRNDEEVSAAWKKEPIGRLRTYLADRKLWNKKQEETLLTDVSRRIDEAVEEYLSTETPLAVEMMDDLFAELPHDLEAQRKILEEM